MADWRQLGLCATADPEVFFTSGPPGAALENLCRSCPSLIPCTFDALKRSDSGYQAGLKVVDRQAIRRWDRRQRNLETAGRPRKDKR
ncbi:WhiB family transcriptional regulator [Nonomuraea indica]|uniref:WhiB family transcriptional regulator n=1 Tax=Nonomuraea indica TaxID=1581193 RepID=UPI001182C036|nr:WhiB family transcriptional regulator [Nonomuraea indica]